MVCLIRSIQHYLKNTECIVFNVHNFVRVGELYPWVLPGRWPLTPSLAWRRTLQSFASVRVSRSPASSDLVGHSNLKPPLFHKSWLRAFWQLRILIPNPLLTNFLSILPHPSRPPGLLSIVVLLLSIKMKHKSPFESLLCWAVYFRPNPKVVKNVSLRYCVREIPLAG